MTVLRALLTPTSVLRAPLTCSDSSHKHMTSKHAEHESMSLSFFSALQYIIQGLPRGVQSQRKRDRRDLLQQLLCTGTIVCWV